MTVCVQSCVSRECALSGDGLTSGRVIFFSNKEPDLRGQMLRGPFVGGPVDVVPTEDITYASCKVYFSKQDMKMFLHRDNLLQHVFRKVSHRVALIKPLQSHINCFIRNENALMEVSNILQLEVSLEEPRIKYF